MDKRVLVINPGSTSTKLALFCGTEKVFDKTLRHSREDLQPFAWVMEQADFRQKAIEQALAEQQVDLNGLDAVCARGGQLPYCAAGTYQVDQDMVDFMYTCGTRRTRPIWAACWRCGSPGLSASPPLSATRSRWTR